MLIIQKLAKVGIKDRKKEEQIREVKINVNELKYEVERKIEGVKNKIQQIEK